MLRNDGDGTFSTLASAATGSDSRLGGGRRTSTATACPTSPPPTAAPTGERAAQQRRRHVQHARRPPAPAAIPSRWRSADFDRDGKPDLATADNGPERVSVLRNNGDGDLRDPRHPGDREKPVIDRRGGLRPRRAPGPRRRRLPVRSSLTVLRAVYLEATLSPPVRSRSARTTSPSPRAADLTITNTGDDPNASTDHARRRGRRSVPAPDRRSHRLRHHHRAAGRRDMCRPRELRPRDQRLSTRRSPSHPRRPADRSRSPRPAPAPRSSSHPARPRWNSERETSTSARPCR